MSETDIACELCDLVFELRPIAEKETQESVKSDVEKPSPIAKLNTILNTFAEKGGLSMLMEGITHHIEEYKREEDISNSAVVTETKKKKYPSANEWLHWTSLVKFALPLKDFVTFFSKKKSCRQLLFLAINVASHGTKVLEDLRGSDSLLDIDDAELTQLLTVITQPLYDAICEMLKSNKSLPLREKSLESGLLGFFMKRLSIITGTGPHDPKHEVVKHIQDILDEELKQRIALRKKNKVGETGSDGKFWASGTGFGTRADDNVKGKWNREAYLREQKLKIKQVALILKCIELYYDAVSLPMAVFSFLFVTNVIYNL